MPPFSVPAIELIAAGLLLARWGEGLLLYFVVGFDDRSQAGIYGIVPAALFIAALVAAIVPAVRAAPTNPIEALRTD
jgi:hypothetical protein